MYRMGDTIVEILKDVYKVELEYNMDEFKQMHADLILIHPKWFHTIASEDVHGVYLQLQMKGDVNEWYHTLCGYKLIKDIKVEKWQVIMKI